MLGSNHQGKAAAVGLGLALLIAAMAHSEGATETVNAGGVAASPSYKMVFTLGQPTQNQQTTSSPTYRMQGGLIGANGTLP